MSMMEANLCEYNILNKELPTLEDAGCSADLKDDIKAIIKSQGFIKYDVRINILPADGGNYLAQLVEIDVTGTTIKGNHDMNLFAKQLTSGEGTLKCLLNVPGMYKNEKLAYEDIKQVYDELQEDAKVPVDERFKMVKCYDSYPGALIMDNLSKQGYKTYSRVEIISLEYAEIAIKKLAKFHALSFALERAKPDFFENKIKKLECFIHFNSEVHGAYRKSMLSCAMNNLDNNLRERAEKYISERLYKYGEYFEKSEISCLCHGDYRVMNMMIKQLDGKISDMVTLDYQLIHYGNPLMDFVYFLFTTTDKKFRKSHLSYLKDTYYETLCDFLKYFDVDIKEFLPRETFERIFKDTLDYGLIILTIIGPLLFADETDIPDFGNISVADMKCKVHDVYKVLLTDTIEDFIEWGLL